VRPRVKTAVIRGKRWVVLPWTDRRTCPTCEAPTTRQRAIRVPKGPPYTEERLGYLLHEIMHAGLWDIDEAAVTELAQDAAALARRLGWCQDEAGKKGA